MKQTLRRELTNIVFLVLIVAAALLIYVLSRAENEEMSQVTAQTGAAIESAPTEPPAKQADPLGVPEAVFETYLATSEVFTAKQDRRDARAYEIIYGDSPPVEASLQYELQNGCISSVELTFALPVVPKDKGKTSIEAYLYESAQALARVHGDAVLAILGDALPATDAKDELQGSSVRFWAEQALLLKKTGEKFEDTQGSYRFLAYRSQGEDAQELICVLYLT